MTRRILSTALLIVASLCSAAGYAADPQFKVGLITESREYEREQGSFAIGGVNTGTRTQWTSRVTVALDGERIAGEWVPKTTISASFEDFPRGADVQAATTRNQLLLKHPDGSVITAKIVNRAKNKDEGERD